MAKSQKRMEARKLRKKGKSIREITEELDVSKGSVSRWCRDIKLTSSQVEKLKKAQKDGRYKGRLKGARVQKERRLQKIKKLESETFEEIKDASEKELFLTGIGLYWGEGSKTDNRVSFYNADPELIKFMMFWFRELVGISEDRFKFHIGINQIHKDRVNEVEKYWSNITGIPRSQFGKTTLIKVKNKKVYENFDDHFGTLTIRIRRSSNLLYKIKGYIKALTKKVNK